MIIVTDKAYGWPPVEQNLIHTYVGDDPIHWSNPLEPTQSTIPKCSSPEDTTLAVSHDLHG